MMESAYVEMPRTNMAIRPIQMARRETNHTGNGRCGHELDV